MRTKKQVIDINDIELDAFDANKLNAQMYEMVEAVVYALSRQPSESLDSKELSQALLRVFVTTHKSMLLLMNREVSDPLMVADAISLVREQVEKVYVLSLIVDNTRRWLRQYHRTNWRFKYERFLRTNRDHGNKLRFQEYLTSYPKLLEKGRYIPAGKMGTKREVLVSKRMARCVKYRFSNPVVSNSPSYFSKKEFDEYFLFPTPGKAIGHVRDYSLQQFLRSWYKEYVWLCKYSHVGVDKVFLDVVSQSRNLYEAQRFDSERERRMQDAAMVSYLAVASGCAVVSNKLQRDYGAIDQLKAFWEMLRQISLDGRKLWEIYVCSLLTTS